MMSAKRLVTVSKFLSKHFRHEPESLKLQLGPGGWVGVDELLEGCSQAGFTVSRAELHEVVRSNDKQRFSFDPTGTLIRANQGHSTEVDLQLEPAKPPAELFHGTTDRNLDAILLQGLRKPARRHVHLSKDVETDRKVGIRHGKPIVLTVGAAAMRAVGFEFFVSENGVWLVDRVPPEFLRAE